MSQNKLKLMGANGRKYYKENFTVKEVKKKLFNYLEN